MIVALPNILEFHDRSLGVALDHREFFLRDFDVLLWMIPARFFGMKLRGTAL
jgi:hypothetical protein